MNLIPVELTEQQAYMFRLLSELGTWDITNGSVTIHFDSQGFPATGEKNMYIKNKKIEGRLTIRVEGV